MAEIGTIYPWARTLLSIRTTEWFNNEGNKMAAHRAFYLQSGNGMSKQKQVQGQQGIG